MKFNPLFKSILFMLFFICISCDKTKVKFDTDELSGGLELMSSLHTGIDFNNSITESETVNHIYYNQIYSGSGVAIGDLNNDGYPDIYFGGNLCLPNKGKQLFHTDGTFNQEMYMVSIATENITLNNVPTEVFKGTNNKKLKYWQFFFSKKNIEKLILKKGQISIRKHNLWHRGTKNNSSDPRLLLSYVLTPKKEKIPIKTNSDKFTIMPNFFKNNLKGRFHETIYSYFSFIIIFFKIIFSLFKRKI